MPEFDVIMKKTVVTRVTAVDSDTAWVIASAEDNYLDGAWELAEPELVEVEERT